MKTLVISSRKYDAKKYVNLTVRRFQVIHPASDCQLFAIRHGWMSSEGRLGKTAVVHKPTPRILKDPRYPRPPNPKTSCLQKCHFVFSVQACTAAAENWREPEP